VRDWIHRPLGRERSRSDTPLVGGFTMHRLFLVLTIVFTAVLSAQTTDSSKGTSRTTTSTSPSLETANEFTTALEGYLKSKGLNPKPAPDHLPNIDVTIDNKKPITPPTPPPPPPPPPKQPPGPAPLKPPHLESYREAMEVFRKEVEKKNGTISSEEYKNGLLEYKRRIDLYKAASKLSREKE
jgi:hypothetical protein